MKTATPRDTEKLLTARQVAERLNIHPRSVWRLADSGDIPKPVKLTPRLVRWRPGDIDRLIHGGGRR